MRSRISTTELIETSANANDAAIRKLASAYTMVADLGTANLNQAAFQTVRRHGHPLVGEAIERPDRLQADLGTAQERVEAPTTACRSRSTS